MHEIWDGVDIKLTFRRGFDAYLMQLWYELVAIMSHVTLSQGPISWSGSCIAVAFTTLNLYMGWLTSEE